MIDSVIDVSRNAETGAIEQFTVIKDGQPSLVKATPENLLLWDPEDELPFENGMHEVLSGDKAIVLSEDAPEVMVAPTNDEYCFILRVNEETVETTPKQAEDVLRAIKDAALDQDFDSIVSVYDDIRASQVRRDVVNALLQTFDQPERIEQSNRGWIVDDFYVVDWSASMYAQTDNPDEADVKRSGSGVREMDKSFEFVRLSMNRDIEPVEVRINGEAYRLTEREMLFLAKINWLLDRRHYHPDDEFWMNSDAYASVDWRTGEPIVEEGDDEPAPSGFNL